MNQMKAPVPGLQVATNWGYFLVEGHRETLWLVASGGRTQIKQANISLDIYKMVPLVIWFITPSNYGFRYVPISLVINQLIELWEHHLRNSTWLLSAIFFDHTQRITKLPNPQSVRPAEPASPLKISEFITS